MAELQSDYSLSTARKTAGVTAAAGRLSVTRLTLTDFRCYRYLRLETDGRPVVLTGANGAGKTNLLEALSFLVPGRGLRGARLGEAARQDRGQKSGQKSGQEFGAAQGPERPWAVAARIETLDGPVEMGTGLQAQSAQVKDPAGMESGAAGVQERRPDRREKRVVHIDGQPATNQGALSLYMDAQWLTPQMDRLFLEGAGGRRRFMDRLAAGYDPAHAGRVAAYEKAMRERNHLLRHGYAADGSWLSALEDTMAAKGVAIAAARREMAMELNTIAAHPDGAFPAAALHMAGAVEEWLESGPALSAEDSFRAALERCRDEDRNSGGAGTGPHRSDLHVRHVAQDRPAEQCSTGEQKALLIAIVLANARLKARARGAAPLLLLDEVVAHLDETRRTALFDEILDLGAQAWMTGTDEVLFHGLQGQAQFFSVADATLIPNL